MLGLVDAFLYLTVGIALLSFRFAIVVGACRKERSVESCYVPEVGFDYASTREAARANRAAEDLGFRHVGFRESKQGRVRYDFWLASDEAILARIAGGMASRISYEPIEMYSRLADDRIVSSNNQIGNVDVSGVVHQATYPHADLRPLLDFHRRRLSGQQIRSLSPSAVVADYLDTQREVVDALVQKGHATYLGRDRQTWRRTIKGALAFYFQSIWWRPLRRSLCGE